jgi:hypothetical protein
VVRAIDAPGAAQPGFPLAGQASSFMYMTVQCEQWMDDDMAP